MKSLTTRPEHRWLLLWGLLLLAALAVAATQLWNKHRWAVDQLADIEPRYARLAGLRESDARIEELDRELAERRIFPAIDVRKSGTRREELLYTPEEYRKIWALRQFIGNEDPTESLEKLIGMLQRTANNREFLANIVAQDGAGR